VTRFLLCSGKALITCGSQALFLYETDALSLLRRSEALQLGFPKWLNVFDANDMRSYAASGVFDAPEDVEVSSGQPFPQSHSAHLAPAALWNLGRFSSERAFCRENRYSHGSGISCRLLHRIPMAPPRDLTRATDRTGALKPKRVSASLPKEQANLRRVLFETTCPVLLDTNVLIWSFGLNAEASDSWQRWLEWLGSRLVIPAWVVHEYNQHCGKPEVANPYKGLTRKVQLALEELLVSASRALDDESANSLKCASRADLERKLSESLAFAQRVADTVSKSDRGHRVKLSKFYEKLLQTNGLVTNIHEFAASANEEFKTRTELRFSPGGEDVDKPTNRSGDYIVWKELIAHCADVRSGAALFISNDVKRDWSYAPSRLEVQEGKEIPWSEAAAQGLHLPNPDLLAEFEHHTGGDELRFATVSQVIQELASTEYNTIDAVEFRQLALAIRATRTPTDQAVDWFKDEPEAYSEALTGAAGWHFSPDEVDPDAFEAWCRHQMKSTPIPLDKVDWMTVFHALFI
jgi:hypothetical protein